MRGNELKPGDLILLRNAGPLGARRMGSGLERVGVVLGKSTVGGARVTLASALRLNHAPLILRPTYRSVESRVAFSGWFESLADKQLHAWRTPRLLFRLMLKHSLRDALPFERVMVDRSMWGGIHAVFLTLDRAARELSPFAGDLLRAEERPWPRPPGTAARLSLPQSQA